MTVTIRGLTAADVPAWADLLAAVERADRTGEHYSAADLAEEIANPDVDPDKDIGGAFDNDELVGYFSVYPRAASREYHKVTLDGAVRPDRRGEGIGTRLARAMMDRATTAHAERHPQLPALLTLRGHVGNTAQRELLTAAGLRSERWSFVMRAHLADLDSLHETPSLPPGLELRRYDPSMAEAMLAAFNATFVDHPNFAPWSESMWRQWVTGSRTFRPELSFVVVEQASPDRVVAYLQTSEFDAYFAATGRREAYVGKVGTRRKHRRRGLAGALLRHGLAEYRAAGYDEAALDVDSDNPTGALGIYRRSGFNVESRWTEYVGRIPALTR